MAAIGRVIIAAIVITTAPNVGAAIYKWVDDKGKVHYSDQPIDPKRAEKIEIAPINTMEGGRDIAESAARYKESANDSQSKQSKNKNKQQDPCKNDLAMYRAFTEQQFSSNGRPKRYYLDNPDGSSMTEKEQTDFINRLGENLRNRGCI